MKNEFATHRIAALLALTCACPITASATRFQTLYIFTGNADGTEPDYGLVAGPKGSLIGTTFYGGVGAGYTGYGTVFQLSPPAKGQTAWTLTTLYTFTGEADGFVPQGVVADSSGALYGATVYGGVFNGACTYNGTDYGCGTVYKLTPPSEDKGAWQYTTLYAFNGGSDGAAPSFGLTIDASGAVYGATGGGGNLNACNGGCGTIFQLTPPQGGGTLWSKTNPYVFAGGKDGTYPSGPLLLDSMGALIGHTASGGDLADINCISINGCGTIFQLTPPAPGKTAWKKQTILMFNGTNGIQPVGGLSEDASGNLYGNGQSGGNLTDCQPGSGFANGCGVALKLTPPAGNGKTWKDTTLFKFTNGADGAYPWDPPVASGANFYMTSSGDEVADFGSIIELTPPAQGKAKWTERTLFSFTNDANSCNPWSALLPAGHVLYGTAAGDGSGPAPYGTVFSITP